MGEGRGAHYTTEHLRQLLEIKKLSEYGLSLDAIKTQMQMKAQGYPLPHFKKPGSIQIQSRVFVTPGV